MVSQEILYSHLSEQMRLIYYLIILNYCLIDDLSHSCGYGSSEVVKFSVINAGLIL